MTIYRYKFSETLLEHMREFADVHRHDDRETFKEAFTKWKDEETMRTIIYRERVRLEELGFTNEIEKKLYTSLRYYFSRRKYEIDSQEKKARTKTYSCNKKEDILKIDTFIREQNDTLPPSELYTAYLNTNADMEENDKLKKLFKNRVYLHKKKVAAAKDAEGRGDEGDEVGEDEVGEDRGGEGGEGGGEGGEEGGDEVVYVVDKIKVAAVAVAAAAADADAVATAEVICS